MEAPLADWQLIFSCSAALPAQVEDTPEQFRTVLKAGGIMDTVEEVGSWPLCWPRGRNHQSADAVHSGGGGQLATVLAQRKEFTNQQMLCMEGAAGKCVTS